MFPKTEANMSKNRIMFLKRFYKNHVSNDFRKLETQISKRNPRLEIKKRWNPKLEYNSKTRNNEFKNRYR